MSLDIGQAVRPAWLIVCAIAAQSLCLANVAADDRWRLDAALGAPDWLTLGGEARIRYESLDGQYRIGRTGSDQAWVTRLLLFAGAQTRLGDFAFELEDARAFGDDRGTPLSASMVNTLEVLQLSYTLNLGGNGEGGGHALKVGRFTMNIGSRRFVERNDYRNVINTYTGGHWRSRWGTTTLDAFYTVPVRKYPRDQDGLIDNDYEADEENWGRRFWGVHLQRPGLPFDSQLDLLVYGLHESDRADLPTPNRHVLAPGFRFFRHARPGGLDFDFEGAYRIGSRKQSAVDESAAELDVEAAMLHAEVGYTFRGDWNLRLGLEYDLASGDEDPGDDVFGQYERFYGTRRRDLGNTGIHGPLTRSNVSVAGVRVSFQRGRWDGRAHVQQARLDSARDFWVVAGLRDPSGRSSRDIGTTFDARVRYWLIPGNLRLEAVGSTLSFGKFPRRVPNGPEDDRALYGALQLTAYF